MAVLSAPRPFLILVEGGVRGALLPLDRCINSLGRSSDNTLQLLDRTISRHHALLKCNQGGPVALLTDLHSSNGTFCNGQAVPGGGTSPVRDGDLIRLGRAILLRYQRLDCIEERTHREHFERSVRDPLTGLHTLDYFLDRLQPLAVSRGAEPSGLVVALIDLDSLARVNLRHGTSAGDELLRDLARALQDQSGPCPLLARLGGDSFGAAWPGGDLAGAREWLESVRGAVARRWVEADGRLIRYSVSAGLGYVPGPQPVASNALAVAESCLARAKVSGGNCVVLSPGAPFW